jgi:hypothetical protein
VGFLAAALGSGVRGQLKAILLGATYTTNIGVITAHWDGRFGHLWSLAHDWRRSRRTCRSGSTRRL